MVWHHDRPRLWARCCAVQTAAVISNVISIAWQMRSAIPRQRLPNSLLFHRRELDLTRRRVQPSAGEGPTPSLEQRQGIQSSFSCHSDDPTGTIPRKKATSPQNLRWIRFVIKYPPLPPARQARAVGNYADTLTLYDRIPPTDR